MVAEVSDEDAAIAGHREANRMAELSGARALLAEAVEERAVRAELLDPMVVEVGGEDVAVGRKNHYGSRSERGTRVAALSYSLIESAKLAGIEPRAYLGEATRRAIRNPGTVTLARDLK